jgi:hypothetical protein
MAIFMALHQVQPHMSADEVARLIYAVISRESAEVVWQKYWLSDETGRLVCLWTAPDTDSLWKLLRSADVPTSEVFPVDEGDPSLLRIGLEK